MTTDHMTAAQKDASPSLSPEFWDRFGWGFCCSVVNRRDGLDGSVGSYTWDGGLGTTWLNDPADDLILILLTSLAWTSPNPPPVAVDFRTMAYAALS
jgi:CubicO group peptidase (beta-lactamase class C family)